MDMSHGHGHGSHTGTPRPDPPGGHGMAVVGTDPIFLSHLPMFMRPHDYQVILQASFGPADAPYRKDRTAHPEARLYTFAPAPFVLPELFPGDGGKAPKRTTFTGSLVRNHFEQPPAHPEDPHLVAPDVVVTVDRVVLHRHFDPASPRAKELGYLLFGKGQERFLAHVISGPPDFDQLLAVDVAGLDLTDDQLAGGVPLVVPGRHNEPGDRLTEGEKVTTTAHLDGGGKPVEVVVTSELYVETADLAEAM